MGYIADFLRTLKDNISVIIRGDYIEGVQDLNTLGDCALKRLDKKSVTPSVKGMRKLTASEKKQVREFYRPYARVSLRYHRLYTDRSGRFCAEYLPEDMFFTKVDRFYCGRDEARYLDNKCYYYRLFGNVKQPELIFMRIGGTYFDPALKAVTEAQAAELVMNEPEAVVKRAVNSEGGAGVSFIGGRELSRDFSRIMSAIPCDVVVQRPVRQHAELSALHKESVNTVRVISLLTDNEVKIYAACLKIGVGEERTDNGCRGGIYCGVKDDGTLNDYGILDNGAVLRRHPDLGYEFGTKRAPCIDKIKELVKTAHPFMAHFRLISWDVTVDENGDAVLIEANLTLGGINNVQMCSGPLFKDDTVKILDEVFGRKE